MPNIKVTDKWFSSHSTAKHTALLNTQHFYNRQGHLRHKSKGGGTIGVLVIKSGKGFVGVGEILDTTLIPVFPGSTHLHRTLRTKKTEVLALSSLLSVLGCVPLL